MADVRVLAASDIDTVLELADLLDVVADGLIAQYRGDVERPERPHLPLGHGLDGDDHLGTGLVMPAYVHGANYFATKVVGVFPDNRDRNLPTVHGAILLVDAATGQAVGLLEGTRVTNARTGCVGGVAVRALVDGPVTLGVLGAGQQARWQTRGIDAAVGVSSVRIYAPSDSCETCATDLRDEGLKARAVDDPAAAVRDADVVVTATTSHTPVFPREALSENAIVVAVGAYTAEMQELETAVVEDATQIFADVPDEVATIGDILNAAVDGDALLPLGGLLAGEIDPTTAPGPILVESVGSAVFDAVASEHLFEAALAGDVGSRVEF